MSKKHIRESRHEEIDDLLGSPPSWLTRWGITVIVSVIAVLLVGAYFFKYPEVVTSQVVITTQHPAIWLVSKLNGRIDSIYVDDQAQVKGGQIVATIENTASIDDVFLLKKEMEVFFDSFKNNRIDHTWSLSRNLNMGELNDCYNQLLQAADNYLLFKNEKLHDLRIQALRVEKERRLQYLADLERQCNSYKDYAAVLSNQYRRDSALFDRKIIPVVEFEAIQKEKISGEIQLNQSLSSLSAVQLEIHAIEQNIAEMQIDFKNQESNYSNVLTAAYELLYNRIREWEKRYILRAPSSGRISFLKYWSKNQYVNVDEKVFTIIPDDYGAILGRCYVNTAGMGKLKEGQPVIIKLDEYPYMEFGMLKGFVSNISLIGIEAAQTEDQSRYGVVEIGFDTSELRSTYNKSIDFKGELTGTAEITIRPMSLLEHLINPLKYLWSKME